MTSTHHFSPKFLWGAAIAAYQIVGSPTSDGKGAAFPDKYEADGSIQMKRRVKA
jgi:beta-glucosidase/6-phospho-beta-glucosidase/beta-galactosidase